jgi:integrase
MLEKSFGLLFYLKQPKNQRRKDRFVYLRITVDGKSKELSTKRTWTADRWNQGLGRATGSKEDTRTLNEYLESLTAKIYEAKKALLDKDRRISAEILKNVVTGQGPERKDILDIFRKHIKVMISLKNIDFKPRTIQRYETAYNHLKSFIKFRFDHISDEFDMELRDINHEFVKEYYNWLRAEKKHSYNSAVKYLSLFKSIIIQCLKAGKIFIDPFADFKTNPKDIPIVPLSRTELEFVKNKSFLTERLGMVRDIFVFSCYTGLSYVDIKNLKRSQIIEDDNGKKWIISNREKTGADIKVPVLRIAQEILDKYAKHPKCALQGFALPVASNQKINEYLKEIAALCGINRRLTFHIARHTFATTIALRNGVPIETVSALLGHKTLRQTQHYAKVVDEKVAEDMEALELKLDGALTRNVDISAAVNTEHLQKAAAVA